MPFTLLYAQELVNHAVKCNLPEPGIRRRSADLEALYGHDAKERTLNQYDPFLRSLPPRYLRQNTMFNSAGAIKPGEHSGVKFPRLPGANSHLRKAVSDNK